MNEPCKHAGQPADQSKEVTVVGAGPAGLACAIALARAGRRAVVREWRKTIGARFHGDLQGLENWSDETDVLKELESSGIVPSFDAHPVYNGVAFDAWGARYEVGSGKPLYYLVHRGPEAGSLDRGLLDCAQKAGVEVRFNDRVNAIDGPAVLGVGPRVADAIAAGYVFETDMPDGNWLCLDDSLAPDGYSYLLVHDGRGTVASCMFKGFKRQADYVERTIAMFRDRAGLVMRKPRSFGGFANFRLPRTGVQGGHPVIGEQAGFQDALAGFGMRYAIRSGVLAAQSLIEGVDYTGLWRKELLPRLRTSVSNRFLFNVIGDRGRSWVLSHILSGKDTRAQLQRSYRPSLPTRLLFPLARLCYRKNLSDKTCDHVNCSCVWCRCGGGGSRLQFT
ncbi:MAG TPA: NAD(P)/FAD-dependent oxidoreductase [Rhodospirillales bacterium]|nr:NAD(P)/FAD-dependent oxidoreductase [Rhodospirillales bacterium]